MGRAVADQCVCCWPYREESALAKKSYQPDFKPTPRIVEPKGYNGGRAKVEAEGRCRIPGCTNHNRYPWVALDPHHLVPRSLRGDDVAANIIPLCRLHHDELKDHRKARSVAERIRMTLTKTEILYVRGKKSKEWLDRYYPDPRRPAHADEDEAE